MFLVDADIDLGALGDLDGPPIASHSSLLETVMHRADAVVMSERQAADNSSLALTAGAAVLVNTDSMQPNTPPDLDLVRRVVRSGHSGVNVIVPPPLRGGVDILKQFIDHRQVYRVSPIVVADLSQFAGDSVFSDVIELVRASADLGVDAFRMPSSLTPAEFKSAAATASGVPLIASTGGLPNVLDTITTSHNFPCQGVTLSAADIVAAEHPQSFFGSAALRAHGGVAERERDAVTEFHRFFAQDDPYGNRLINMSDSQLKAVFEFWYDTRFSDQTTTTPLSADSEGIGASL